MTEAIVIIAAMPGELKPLVRSWAALATASRVLGWRHPNAPVFALCGGMGAGAVTRAFSRARQVCEPTQVYSVGWAGALHDDFLGGEVIAASTVRDLQTGETFAADGDGGLLLTSTRVAVREDKQRLATSYRGARAVDMEAATLARLCTANGIPFRALKAISDTLHEDLPDLNPYVREDGSFAMARFIAHVALRPRTWGPLMKFGRQANVAATNLCATLSQEIGVS